MSATSQLLAKGVAVLGNLAGDTLTCHRCKLGTDVPVVGTVALTDVDPKRPKEGMDQNAGMSSVIEIDANAISPMPIRGDWFQEPNGTFHHIQRAHIISGFVARFECVPSA